MYSESSESCPIVLFSCLNGGMSYVYCIHVTRLTARNMRKIEIEDLYWYECIHPTYFAWSAVSLTTDVWQLCDWSFSLNAPDRGVRDCCSCCPLSALTRCDMFLGSVDMSGNQTSDDASCWMPFTLTAVRWQFRGMKIQLNSIQLYTTLLTVRYFVFSLVKGAV